MRIAIIYSLPTRRALASPYKATDEDTGDSALEVAGALREKGAQVWLVPVSEDTIDAIATLNADVIFNLIEWDGLDTSLTLKAIAHIESLHIPYTGSSLATIELVSDKVNMKKKLDINGLPTPVWQLFRTGEESVRDRVCYPVILKLAWEHCSVGLTQDAIITDDTKLLPAIKERIRVFKQPVYIEEFIQGRELQVTLLGQAQGLNLLPPAEIIFTTEGTRAFLTYESRWNETHPEYDTSDVIRANLSPTLMQKIYQISNQTYRVFGFHDYARLDMRLKGKDVYILEANANPGLGDDDDYGMTISYKAAGMSFADFIWEIVQSCLRRHDKFMMGRI